MRIYAFWGPWGTGYFQRVGILPNHIVEIDAPGEWQLALLPRSFEHVLLTLQRGQNNKIIGAVATMSLVQIAVDSDETAISSGQARDAFLDTYTMQMVRIASRGSGWSINVKRKMTDEYCTRRIHAFSNETDSSINKMVLWVYKEIIKDTKFNGAAKNLTAVAEAGEQYRSRKKRMRIPSGAVIVSPDNEDNDSAGGSNDGNKWLNKPMIWDEKQTINNGGTGE